MAEKYDVADVHSWAVAHFIHRYPPSLTYLSPNDTLIESASFALNLARMYDVRSVLPSIYFALASGSWHRMRDELRELLARWLDREDIERVVEGRNVLWKRTLIVRYEAEAGSSPMLEPYCATPGPSGHFAGAYSRAAKLCREILAERLREALSGPDTPRNSPRAKIYPSSGGAGQNRSPSPVTTKGRRMSGSAFSGAKPLPDRNLLDALQVLEEMDDMDIVVWPSPVCHICSLVHARWVAQTRAKTINDMLEAFQT
ncbi:hypothetical protein FRC09_019132 [Ceratobasidium sp. 395]|nr:hypothetical protein FRC09_019132 [Ceratobasidium sp. 395]